MSTVKKEAPPARRRTGLANGIIDARKAERRRLSKKELSLPFLDTCNWFQGDDDINTKDLNCNVFAQESDENITNMLKVPTENRNASIFDRLFHQVSFIVRKDSNIHYNDVSDRVLSSDRVKTAIKTSVMEDLKGHDAGDSSILEAQQHHKERAIRGLHQMRSCISSFLLKIAAWVMYKLLGRMLDGLEVRKDQIQTLKRVSKENVPMIYLPLHRSHLDYILVTFILFMNDIRSPLVAAGNNLMIPFFGALLRGLGAFFIKRKLDPQNGQRDYVYRAVLHTYMEESLKAGHSLEFFIEGGRSRTGKAVLPKAGLLSIVVDTLMSGAIKDAYIVPISMSYEKLLDGNFVPEQMGKPKKMESFSSAIQAIWRILHSNFGTVRVDFCQPFSLKEFLLAAEFSYNSPSRVLQPSLIHQNQFFNKEAKFRRRSEYGTEVVSEDHRQLIKDLADYVVYSASSAFSLMSTNTMAFLLLTKYRKGTSYDNLVRSMNWVREEITKRNKTIHFFGESTELVSRASGLLGKNLVHVECVNMEWAMDRSNNNLKLFYYKPAVALPDVLELQYYANSVLPVFLLESIIVISVSSSHHEKYGNEKNYFLPRSVILKQAIELCSILQHEFIFSPPGTSICTVLNAAIDDLLDSSVLQLKEKPDDENEEKLDHVPDDFFTHGDQTELQQELKFNPEKDNSDMIQFLQCILTPLLESYHLAAGALSKMVDTEMEESSLLQEMKTLGRKKMHLGQLYHEECLGLDAFKNALKLFESWKVVSVRTLSSQKLYSLQNYYNDPYRVDDVINRIAKFTK